MSDVASNAASDEDHAAPKPRKPSQTTRAKKPSIKKPRINGARPAVSGTIARIPSRPKKTVRIDPGEKGTGLFGMFCVLAQSPQLAPPPPLHSLNTDVFILSSTADIFASGDSAQFVAQQWLEKYKVGDADALGDLINCILRCAGCDLEVTVDDIRDPENIPNRLLDLQSVYQEVRLGIAARTNLVGGNKINCLYSNKSSITR
jgi:cohesin complex subunit SA-1/2